MIWTVRLDEGAARELRALGHAERGRVLRYLRERIATVEDPRRFGKPLIGDLKGLWRWRVADLRILARIDDRTITVVVLSVGQRQHVYR
jgi:mRNA interferase RelE/StbE